jgi:hypothetical protein
MRVSSQFLIAFSLDGLGERLAATDAAIPSDISLPSAICRPSDGLTVSSLTRGSPFRNPRRGTPLPTVGRLSGRIET